MHATLWTAMAVIMAINTLLEVLKINFLNEKLPACLSFLRARHWMNCLAVRNYESVHLKNSFSF